MRKLATVRTIRSIIEHTNADTLSIAFIDNWQVIIQKDSFKVGDTVVYFEIDSVLPIREEYEFLRKSSYVSKEWLGEGFRIRTVKLRGEVSQGLIIPLPNYLPKDLNSVGTDVTEFLDVRKWEPPIPMEMGGEASQLKPSFFPKTDVDRLQNFTVQKLDEIKNRNIHFEVSQKYDGTSMSVYWNDGHLGVCGRTREFIFGENKNSFVKTAIKTNIVKALNAYGKNIAVQGELCGWGVQKNIHGYKTQEFVIFDIYDIDAARYFNPEERYQIINDLRELGYIGMEVEILHRSITIPSTDITDYLEMAAYKLSTGKHNEGIVWKGIEERITFKVINNLHLLAGGD